MCFSAQASLTAAAAIGGIGIASLFKVTSRSQLLLAMIPLLFGFQQLIEGLIWLDVGSDGRSILFFLWKYIYIFFAFMLWPILIPVALASVEKVYWRKITIWGLAGLGLLIALTYFYFVFRYGINVTVDRLSLIYNYTTHPPYNIFWIGIGYVFAVILPWFLSSLKGARTLGLIGLISVGISLILFHAAFVSVWCFFAAIISAYIYKIIRDNPVGDLER